MVNVGGQAGLLLEHPPKSVVLAKLRQNLLQHNKPLQACVTSLEGKIHNRHPAHGEPL
jgi:hypothetical protein